LLRLIRSLEWSPSWAEASLVGSWYEYTPTGALDIAFEEILPTVWLTYKETLWRYEEEHMVTNNAVFIIGYDYDKKGLPFETYADNRMKMLLKGNPTLKVTVFNVGTGSVRLSEIDSDKKVRMWKTLDQFSFKAVSRANYTVTISDGSKHYTFDKNPQGIMSIVDVYGYIQTLGQKEPGTLMEVGFLAHGWIDGPILVNSDDHAPDTDPKDPTQHPRDSNDKDARADKDFVPPTMDAKALALFQKAFAPTASIWVWGCAFTASYFQVLYKLLHSPVYRRTPAKKLTDQAVIHFSFTNSQAEDFFRDDHQFFPSKHKKDAKHKNEYYPLEFDRTFAEVKAFLTRGLAETYCKCDYLMATKFDNYLA
jgi:hypothetical protein